MFLENFMVMLKELSNEPVPVLPARGAWLEYNLNQKNLAEFIKLYYMLQDDASRNTFLKILSVSLRQYLTTNSGGTKFFDDETWAKYFAQAQKLDCVSDSYALDIIETFILEGYRYGNICVAKHGEVVLDCGAYTGNTALYFSRLVGPEGFVHAFEAMPDNYDKLCVNMANKGVSNVICKQVAIGGASGHLCFTPTASASSHVANVGISVRAISIDEYVRENNLGRVDFIKMDTEGGELAGLKGAVETIRRFRPKLAICIYHKASDFIELPAQILKIAPTYKFYMKHNSQNFWETVLFAIPGEAPYELPGRWYEVSLVYGIWQLISGDARAAQKQKRENLLKLYDCALSASNLYPAKVLYDTRNFHFSYYPLTRDGRLHYEFIFGYNSVRVSLHFEGHWAKHSGVIDEIYSASQISERIVRSSGIKACIMNAGNQMIMLTWWS